jgi:hypothetical protein
VTQSGLNPLDVVVERNMRAWLERAVIGLNLCPFAKAVYVRGQIHYAVSGAQTPAELAEDLAHELQTLVALEADVRDTTLLMAPNCLDEFVEFNDFLRHAERILVDLELDGIVQIASFHPNFQFANTALDEISNYTNRAPYPTLHLLRETSVDRAVAAFPQAESIFERNIQTLEKLGHAGWLALDLPRAARLPKS